MDEGDIDEQESNFFGQQKSVRRCFVGRLIVDGIRRMFIFRRSKGTKESFEG